MTALAGVTGLVLAACSAPGASTAPSSSAPTTQSSASDTAGESSTSADTSSADSTAAGTSSAAAPFDPSTAGKVTLRVWDQEVRGGQNAQMTQLNKEFMAKYPNVTIERNSQSFSDLKTTLRLALSGNNPPDVVEVNQGYPDMVTFVKGGMLQPMDKYATEYGWADRYPASLLNLNRVSDDASHFGEGSLYGLSQMGEYIGVYYSKKQLAKYHLEPPTTWDGFVSDLAAVKAAGGLPIQWGNLDQWPAIHTFGVIQAQTAGKDTVRNLVFGTGNASWTDSGTLEAAKTLRQWATDGYFPKGVNGVGYDDSNKAFAAGQGVFNITGTWEAAVLEPTMGDDLGMFVPPVGASGSLVTTGGESLALAITSKSANPDVAAAYIDFMTNAHADDVMTKTGNLPAVVDDAALPAAGTVEADMFGGWENLSKADGLVPYLDYSTPTFYDTITASLQGLIGGKTTPEEFTKALQADYAKFHGSK
jgi:raffinose/stachyose/melibiose transport system substrate-binding protein